ncbi:hypothetical protein CU048_01035 [Beijerinckiaceae bacterium]|nr:hypothetical protein CU048_01035 [Beijerinckiaceae bacterium]
MSSKDRARLDRSLQRIDALLSALETSPYPATREPARELIEIVLDMHALALARIMAAASNSDDRTLLPSLAEDPQIKAVLVLHGLHPEELDMRVRKAVNHLRAELGVQGLRIELADLTSATVRLRVHGDNLETKRSCLREIEQTLMEAAPDLESIVIEEHNEAAPNQTTALAG